ncbi:lipopolysaccharide heptosyltransferase I [Thermodesulfatator atlanticus]|uniref:lipopolysaccharide heptosyltransferase I n=1 Tax=Thermodesulfatator atlanticus TaxID=501497 RepID=UPI0003B652A1|nr:lipopolysaccharide heptosyltransferase I [Thermodesulfatator atlanticus]
MKVLIIKLSSLGDVIHSLPVLSVLKGAGAEVDWVVEEENEALLRGHPYLSRLIVWPRKRLLKRLKARDFAAIRETYSLVREIRAKTYDVVIDLQGLLKSGVVAGLSRARYKIGFANHREASTFFYNVKLAPYSPDEHAVRRYLSTLNILGLETNHIDFVFPPFPPFKGLAQKFALPEKFAVLIPCTRWQTKHWTISGWQELSLLLTQKGLAPVFVGSAADKSYVAKILAKGEGLSLCGKTSLLELASIISQATLVVSVDTGPMHLAAALNKPVVALFGPTAPWRTGPLGERHRVIQKKLPCVPCFQRTCDTTRCMQEIAAEEIIEALDSMALFG